MLDAAHLSGFSLRIGEDKATDGVLLLADLHRLFNARLLSTEDGVVRVTVGALCGA